MGHLTTETIKGCPWEVCDTSHCNIGSLAVSQREVNVEILEEAGLEVKKPFAGMPDDRDISICSGAVVRGTRTSEALNELGLLEESVQLVGIYPVKS